MVYKKNHEQQKNSEVVESFGFVSSPKNKNKKKELDRGRLRIHI